MDLLWLGKLLLTAEGGQLRLIPGSHYLYRLHDSWDISAMIMPDAKVFPVAANQGFTPLSQGDLWFFP